ncbi:hypothetical protein [Quadrisphaera sp. INWT6]|uniref:hypothetical protein n=1 Tax=Quadrisphaera sp. INWT6 TaxID=2596917 RepID=UPI001892461E|nr:hypothetical protein [Quadrisphaera sp. INWT6]
MSEESTPSASGHEQGVGKTGGLPGANADPQASQTPERELQEVQAGEVAPE